MLWNLVNNAIYWSLRRSAKDDQASAVTLAIERQEKDLVITVSDNGNGVPKKEQADLFKEFHTTRLGGTGLGLVFVQKIANSYGGSVTYTDAPGGGAVFTVRIPAEAAMTVDPEKVADWMDRAERIKDQFFWYGVHNSWSSPVFPKAISRGALSSAEIMIALQLSIGEPGEVKHYLEVGARHLDMLVGFLEGLTSPGRKISDAVREKIMAPLTGEDRSSIPEQLQDVMKKLDQGDHEVTQSLKDDQVRLAEALVHYRSVAEELRILKEEIYETLGMEKFEAAMTHSTPGVAAVKSEAAMEPAMTAQQALAIFEDMALTPIDHGPYQIRTRVQMDPENAGKALVKVEYWQGRKLVGSSPMSIDLKKNPAVIESQGTIITLPGQGLKTRLNQELKKRLKGVLFKSSIDNLKTIFGIHLKLTEKIGSGDLYVRMDRLNRSFAEGEDKKEMIENIAEAYRQGYVLSSDELGEIKPVGSLGKELGPYQEIRPEPHETTGRLVIRHNVWIGSNGPGEAAMTDKASALDRAIPVAVKKEDFMFDLGPDRESFGPDTTLRENIEFTGGSAGQGDTLWDSFMARMQGSGIEFSGKEHVGIVIGPGYSAYELFRVKNLGYEKVYGIDAQNVWLGWVAKDLLNRGASPEKFQLISADAGKLEKIMERLPEGDRKKVGLVYANARILSEQDAMKIIPAVYKILAPGGVAYLVADLNLDDKGWLKKFADEHSGEVMTWHSSVFIHKLDKAQAPGGIDKTANPAMTAEEALTRAVENSHILDRFMGTELGRSASDVGGFVRVLREKSAGVYATQELPQLKDKMKGRYHFGLMDEWYGRMHYAYGLKDHEAAGRHVGVSSADTEHVLERLTRQNIPLVFLVPQDIDRDRNYSSNYTTLELRWLMDHPGALRNIVFVFGDPADAVRMVLGKSGLGQTQSPRESAMKGGIDLTPKRMDLQTSGSGEGITFNIDPVMLQKLQDAKGFVPVIMSIQPINNLPEFLGVKMDGGPNLQKQAFLLETSPTARGPYTVIGLDSRRRFIV